MISEIVMAGEDLPDELELKSKRLKKVVSNCVSEYMNKEMVSNQWIPNVLDVTDALKVSLLGKKINGLVQRFEVAPDFNLSMHCEKQLQAIKALKEENRILHLDSSGKYCLITREMNDQYQQLMNYVFILKDVSDFEKPAIIINEVITSRQDTCLIGEMFLLLKHNYRKLFDTTLVFRLIVLDLSWASIHFKS